MCTPFSNFQNLNAGERDPRVIEKEKEAGRRHLEWCCRLYAKQISMGVYFLHEHPAMATSWKEPCVERLLTQEGVSRVRADQCQLGQENDVGDPVMKPTGFMSNSEELLRALGRRCFGKGGLCSRPKGGRHAHCLGKVARRAAIFQEELRVTILRGIRSQLRKDHRLHDGVVGANAVMLTGDDEILSLKPEARVPERGVIDRATTRALGHLEIGSQDDGEAFAVWQGRGDFVDDLTGLPLPPELCKAARQKEIEYFKSKGVWQIRTVNEARRRMGRPPISVRWVETNKGDDKNPNIRSRLVAREIRTPGQDAIFAPTPPLESLRMVLSMATTDFKGMAPHCRDPDSEDRIQILLIDISRAYFNAHTDPDDPVYVQLPPELRHGPQACGLLKRHMYGTRRAAEG